MRLGKDDFNTLLNEPMLHWVDYRRRRRTSSPRAATGSMCGCRASSSTLHFDDALNVPLYFIRLKLKTLDAERALRRRAATPADAARRRRTS